MKNLFLFITAFSFLQACNNDNTSNENVSSGNEDPQNVQPVSDAIPDSTKLVNDSVIVPDTTPGNGSVINEKTSTPK